jgi:hypothetical protein
MIIALVGAAPVGLVVACMAYAYARAAAARTDRRDACPFEDDDDEARPFVREAVDVVRESAALLRLLGAALLPAGGATAAVHPGSGPVVVLLPERGLPARSLARLGRQLARDLDASVLFGPGGFADEHTRADRAAATVSALAGWTSGRALLLVGHGAGGLVARRAAAVLRHPALRVVTIATAHVAPDRANARDSLVDRIEVVNLYSLHDAIVAPPERAYLPGAYNMALRDEGHFGLVLGARPYELLRESLADLVPHAAAS